MCVFVATAPAAAQSMPEILVQFLEDVVPGLMRALLAVCWLLGLLAIGAGLLRLKRHAEGGGAPSAGGTALTFVLAMALLALPSILDATSASLFGTAPAAGQQLAWVDGADRTAFATVISGAVVVVQVVGLIAFVQGWFVIRDAADGRGGGFAQGIWRIVGGTLCWHVVPFVGAVQASLGLTVLEVR